VDVNHDAIFRPGDGGGSREEVPDELFSGFLVPEDNGIA
jgi:hypothetical protein